MFVCVNHFYLSRFYDEKTGECQEFYFGGCRGNSNNFMKKIDCEVRCKKDKKSMKNSRIEDIYLNDGFKDALDVLVKKRMNDRSEGMNEGFIEIEEQREVLSKLEKEQMEAKAAGKAFEKMGELLAAQKKLMMMEKRMMMDKQMMMFKQKQMMMAKQRAMLKQKQQHLMSGSNHMRQQLFANSTIDKQTKVINQVSYFKERRVL